MTTAICAIPARRQVGLVVEDPAEVLAIREHVGLQRQERAARVDEVDARQAVLGGDLLQAQVLLDRHREVRAALDGGVVGDDRDLAATDDPDAGHDPGRGRLAVVHVPRGERGQLEERGTGIHQAVDAIPREQLAPARVPRDGLVAAAAPDERESLAQLRDEREVGVPVGVEGGGRAGFRRGRSSAPLASGIRRVSSVAGAWAGPMVRRAHPPAAVGSRLPGGGAAPAGWR